MIEFEQFSDWKRGSPALDRIYVARDLAHKGTRALIDPIEARAGEIMLHCFAIARTMGLVGLRRRHRERLDRELRLTGAHQSGQVCYRVVLSLGSTRPYPAR